jgi:hypothetical protein
MENKAPLFSKARGQSYMVSDFLVAHPSGPYFSLSKTEFERATTRYPQSLSGTNLSFLDYSATAGIHVGHAAYFDNDTVLEQFERLF